LLGSRAFLGRVSQADLDLTDAAGMRCYQAMVERGLDPDLLGQDPPPPVAAYLELHIEQGPALESLDLPVGVVTGIVGIIDLVVSVEGRAGHAGTTPMAGRADALAAAAEMVLAIEAAPSETGPSVVATVGRLEVSPGSGNVIPGHCSFTVDLRDFDSDMLDRAADRIHAAMRTIAQHRGVIVSIEETMRVEAVPTAPRLQQALADACQCEGAPVHSLPSGAGHDAQVLAEITEVGMLFTRCTGGISHNPAEAIREEDGVLGAQVLLDAVLDVAG
jgi:allantoate deiminase